MVPVILSLFALPAAVIAAGALICLARGASRPRGTLRTMGLVLLPALGSLGALVAVICFTLLALGLVGRASPHRSGQRADRGRYYRHRTDPGGYALHRGSATEQDVRRMQRSAPATLKCTNGWVPVYGRVEAVQSFKAPRGPIAFAGFRAARRLGIPDDNLKVGLRDPRTGRSLATWTLKSSTFGKDAVTRFFQNYAARLSAPGLLEGRRYELVFSSRGTRKDAPWLVNCFYRDTYPHGSYRSTGYAPGQGNSLDLAFRMLGSDEKALVSSIPADADLGRREHFGLAYAELLRHLRSPIIPPPPGSDPEADADSVSTPLPTPGPKLTREQALARARELGRPGGSWPDACEARLSWIPLEKKFLAVYDSREGSLTDFADFLKMIGRKEISVRGLAFTREKVWAATSRGALVYDRRTRAWSQLAVNLDAALLEADFRSVRATEKSVIFTTSTGKRYALDRASNKWANTDSFFM